MFNWSPDKLRALSDAFRKPAGESDDPKERTRLRIVGSATEAFTRFGFRRASIDDIARGAGVGKGTIYLYFPSKRDLFLAAVAEEKAAILPEMMALSTLPPEARLEHMLRVSFRFVIHAPLTASLLRREHGVSELLEDVGEELYRSMSAMGQGWMIELFDPHKAWPEAERQAIAATLSVISMLLPHLDKARALGDLPIEAFADTLAGLLARGARPPETP